LQNWAAPVIPVLSGHTRRESAYAQVSFGELKDSFKMSDQHHRRPRRRTMISGASDGYVLTVADMLDAIDQLPDDAEIIFGTCSHGGPQQFYRLKMRGEKTLGIEFG
jgi:hypothetical protein